jgi:hypothetical protein
MKQVGNFERVAEAYHRALDREQVVGFDALDDSEKELIATLLFHEEVGNGGFHQWFTNPHSDRAAYAIRFLTRVGAGQRLRLIKRASALFPGGRIPVTSEERWVVAQNWSEQDIESLESIDDEYYAIERDIYEDLAALV